MNNPEVEKKRDVEDWQEAITHWADDHLPPFPAECISLWSDSIASFVVEHIAEAKGNDLVMSPFGRLVRRHELKQMQMEARPTSTSADAGRSQRR